MGKNKKYNKNQNDEDEDFGKKKKNIITQQLLMDKSNMDFTEFIPLLPQDVLYPPFKISSTSTKALLKIVTDMNYLLYLQPKNFWATVTYNISFNRCLSSCLSQMSVKWMNKYQRTSEQMSEFDNNFNYRTVKDTQAYTYVQALQDVLLKIVYRIMSFQQQDPKLNEIYNFGQNTIKKLNVFNYIKLNELIEIYGQKEENHCILKIIANNFLKTVSNPYKYFTQSLLPHIVKKLQQTNRDVKLVTDREQFGINYSYTRTNQKYLSPGEQELKRKSTILITYISFLKLIQNTKLISQEILDHFYFNSQINFIMQNAFYQLDAAYKIWNPQGMEKRLQPMMNHIFAGIIAYFVEYFSRVQDKLVNRNIKQYIQAQIKTLQRLFVDYGKRHSLGKKGSTIRHMTLFKLVMKRINLTQIFQKLYLQEEQNRTYEFNMEFFIDFKLAIEDCYNEDNYINENQQRQNQIEEETQIPDDFNVNDIDDHNQSDQQHKKHQSSEQQPQKLTFTQPQDQDKLEFIVSKKQREDDYYEQLYLKQKQRFKIQYEDQYDDLVDYDKRPLFMDSASSDSQPQEEMKMQRLVSNQNNQKVNQLKHIKFQEKQKQKKKQNKYSKLTHQQKLTLIDDKQHKSNKQEKPLKDDTKVKYVAKAKDRQPQRSTATHEKAKYVAKEKNTQEEKKPQKPKGNNLQDLLQQQKMPQDDEEQQDQERGRGGQGGRGGYKRRYNPQKTHNDKSFNDKGRNSNKNRQHGNPTNQAFGGGKKYKAKY